jgi:hypothetical protein
MGFPDFYNLILFVLAFLVIAYYLAYAIKKIF